VSDDYRARLIAVREKLNLTREEMAARLLTPADIYSGWEYGTRRIPGTAVVAAEGLTTIQRKSIRRTIRSMVLDLADGSRSAAEIAEILRVPKANVAACVHQLRAAGKLPDGAVAKSKHKRPRPKQDAILKYADGTRTLGEIADLIGARYNSTSVMIANLRKAGMSVPLKRKRSRQ